MQTEQQFNIPLNDTKEVKCEKCESDRFVQQFFLRKVSRFATGMMDDALYPFQTFACASCGHINKEMLPPKGKEDVHTK